MPRCFSLLLVLAVLLSVCIGCSGGNNDPLAPEKNSGINSQKGDESSATDSSELWGLWSVDIDPRTLTASIPESRAMESHINITHLIPTPKILVKSYNPSTRIVTVDVTLRNPYQITGYDVRCIIYSDSFGHYITNPDGYTSLYDIAGGDDINPYRSFAKESTNREFGRNSSFTEEFQVYLPVSGGPITFAVDASYPSHCEEPYGMEVLTQKTLYDIPGSSAHVQMEILDWQNDVDNVSIQAPGITGESSTNLVYQDEFIWELNLKNNANAPAGEYRCLLKATSSGSGTFAYYQYLTFVVTHSDVPLTVDFPNTGEDLYVTDTDSIKWRAVIDITDVKIELSFDSGASYNYTIIDSTPNTGSLDWQVPSNAVGEHNRIRISDAQNPSIFDESDVDFRIICEIPSVPQNVTASVSESTDWVKVAWNAVQYATGYNVYRDSELIESNWHDLTWYDYTAVPGTHYNYVVEAFNDCGVSDKSSPSAEGWRDTGVTEWTFLVYMHESNLGQFAVEAINEMECAGSVDGNMNILVLWDKTDSPDDVILHIDYDSQGMIGPIISDVVDDNHEVIPYGGLDMGSQTTLERFLRWSMREYPAQNYALVLWDHGNGPFGASQDGGFIRSCCNGLSIWEIRDGCQTVLNENPGTGRFGFIGFDACLMGYIEIAYCLRNVTKCVIGSEMVELAPGWRYTNPLKYLKNNAVTCTWDELSIEFVNTYLMLPDDGSTMAAASTDKTVSNVIPALNSFATEMKNSYSSYRTQITNARSACGNWGAFCDEGDIRDLGYFVNLISSSSVSQSLKDKASDLANQIESAMLVHGHVGSGAAGCPYSETGWQVWFPSNYYDSSMDSKRGDYQRLGFTDTAWDEFLARYN
jgi:hypothetical protein